MKQSLAFIVLIVLCIGSYGTEHLPNAWINEIHYDNNGGDVNEAVEIVIEKEDEFNLELLKLELYNGSGGTVYKTMTLKDSVACAVEGDYAFYCLNIAGIQNGAPDGFALSYEDHLLQFLSYEGAFEASEGTALGISSVDIAVEEDGSTEIAWSLQLTGTGLKYADFTWQAPDVSTYCGLNNGQLFSVATTSEPMNVQPKLWLGENRHLHVRVTKQQVIRIFDLSGRMVHSSQLRKGINIVDLDLKGMYIVKTDAFVQKVMLR